VFAIPLNYSLTPQNTQLEPQVAMSTEDLAEFFVKEFHLARLNPNLEQPSTLTLNSNMIQLGNNVQHIVQNALNQVQAQNAALNIVLAANTKRIEEMEAKEKKRLEKDKADKERLAALHDKVETWMAKSNVLLTPEKTITRNESMSCSERSTPVKDGLRILDWTPEEIQVLRDTTSDFQDISTHNVDFVRGEVNKVGGKNRTDNAIFCKAYRLLNKRGSTEMANDLTAKRAKKGKTDLHDLGEYVMAKYNGKNEVYPAFIHAFRDSRIELRWEDGDTKYTIVPSTDVLRQNILKVNNRGKALVHWIDFEDDVILPKEWIETHLVGKKALARFNKNHMPNAAAGLLDLHYEAVKSLSD
tara:strand:- start:6705 stop:7775 length:1071 start_codon:yes stop_codon:yes gene_type:complete